MKQVTIYYKMRENGETYAWKTEVALPENAIIISKAKDGW